MQRGLFLRGEKSGRFDHHLHAKILPWELGWIAFGEHLERLAIDRDAIAFGSDILDQGAMNRVILQEMSQRWRVGDVVDGDDLQRVLVMQGSAVKHSADSSKSIDSYPNRHRF